MTITDEMVERMKEIDRLSLVIESAVRRCDPRNYEAVLTLLQENRSAFETARYANAEPDEPMFVLLGRDKHAPLLVGLWAELREMEGEDAAKVDEAYQCSVAMRKWRQKREAALSGKEE